MKKPSQSKGKILCYAADYLMECLQISVLFAVEKILYLETLEVWDVRD